MSENALREELQVLGVYPAAHVAMRQNDGSSVCEHAVVAGRPLDLLYISAVTLAEIRFGIELVADATKRAELTNWLANDVRPLFDQRVFPVSEDVLFRLRLLVEEGRKVGHTFSQPDLLIAATGLQHGMTVVSRDTSEYAKAGIPFLNPWTS